MDWIVTPSEGTRPEDLLNPEYWKHVVAASGIEPMAEITAWAMDGSWVCDYRVIHVNSTHAKLIMKGKPEYLDEVKESDLETDTLFVKWISPAARYGVRRKSDNVTLKDGFQNKQAAARWMHENLSMIAA